jgi:hypothetical protein
MYATRQLGTEMAPMLPLFGTSLAGRHGFYLIGEEVKQLGQSPDLLSCGEDKAGSPLSCHN